MTGFKDEVEALIGIRPSGWTFHGDTSLDYDANVWFSHTPSEDRPRGLPLTWDELDTLNDEYGVIHVESHSNGRTGSKLCVRLNEL